MKVLWEFPPEGWVKYNTDGASKGNLGVSLYAYCLRDHKGDILYADCDRIDNTTNTVAEAKAILEACKHSKLSQHEQIIIQTDSILMWKVLEGKWEIPWVIEEMIKEIKECMQHKQHIFQQGIN